MSAVESLYACGHALLQGGQYERASAIFRAMVMCDPKDERGWLALGMCHEAAQQPLVALHMYRVAMDENQSVRCAIAYAQLVRKLGGDEEADNCFELATEWAQDDDELKALVAVHKEQSS
jgi:tetratricopeptide (TPR) repeat protein